MPPVEAREPVPAAGAPVPLAAEKAEGGGVSRVRGSGDSPGPAGPKPAAGRAATEEVAAASRKIRVPLSRFAKDETVRLQGSGPELRLTVPVNPRMRINAVAVGLVYVPSISLDESDSHLSIHWNGHTLSGRMDPAPKGQWSRRLTGILEQNPVYSPENELRIGTVHSGRGAAKGIRTPPTAMWTEIDLDASWVELGYGWMPADLEPGEFARLADCRPWLETRIAIVTPSPDEGNDDPLRWGGWVAQWLGCSGGARMPELVHRTCLDGWDADAVVIGARNELPRMLSQAILGQAGGEDAGLFANPENPRHLVLLLTGASRDATEANVRRFVEENQALPGETETVSLSPGSPFAFLRGQAESPGAKAGKPMQIAFHAAARDADTVASVWMLAGKIASISGVPPGGIEITGRPPSGKGHWILAGPIAAIDRKILSAAPAVLPPGGPLPALLAPAPEKGSGKEKIDAAGGDAPGARQGEGLLMRFESPFARGARAMIVTADDSAGLHEAVKTLLEPAIWDRIEGDTVSWGGLRGQSVECRFFSGDLAAWETGRGGGAAFFGFWTPWILGGLGLAGLAALAMRLRRPAVRPRKSDFEWDPGEKPAL